MSKTLLLLSSFVFVNYTTDIELVCCQLPAVFPTLVQSVAEGVVPEALLDQALSRTLPYRFELGTLNPPGEVLLKKRPRSLFHPTVAPHRHHQGTGCTSVPPPLGDTGPWCCCVRRVCACVRGSVLGVRCAGVHVWLRVCGFKAVCFIGLPRPIRALHLSQACAPTTP
jgi:hypothetical protein